LFGEQYLHSLTDTALKGIATPYYSFSGHLSSPSTLGLIWVDNLYAIYTPGWKDAPEE